jgi:hypothetical protein
MGKRTDHVVFDNYMRSFIGLTNSQYWVNITEGRSCSGTNEPYFVNDMSFPVDHTQLHIYN